jgi:hypothetical protein
MHFLDIMIKGFQDVQLLNPQANIKPTRDPPSSRIVILLNQSHGGLRRRYASAKN